MKPWTDISFQNKISKNQTYISFFVFFFLSDPKQKGHQVDKSTVLEKINPKMMMMLIYAT